VEREQLSITHNLDILRQTQPFNFFGDKCARQKYYSGLNKVGDRRIVRRSKEKHGVESERVRNVRTILKRYQSRESKKEI